MIIGLHGKAGAGKDTFADCLVEKHGFVKRGFADPLYEEVAAAFGVSIEWLRDRTRKELPQPELALALCENNEFSELMLAAHGASFEEARSPRWVLQQWGTEYRRSEDINYWLKQFGLFTKAAYDTGAKGVVSVDTRFENEAQFIRNCGGILVEVKRPGLPEVEGAHVSATGLPVHLIDHVIYNAGLELAGFKASVGEFYMGVLYGRVKRQPKEVLIAA